MNTNDYKWNRRKDIEDKVKDIKKRIKLLEIILIDRHNQLSMNSEIYFTDRLAELELELDEIINSNL